MGDHDNQAVLGDFGEQVHNLDAGLGVKGAGGLVGEQNLGVVDEGAGNGHALHLSAGKLAGLFVGMLREADAVELFERTPLALLGGHARKRQRQLDVGENRLMRDEVIALEDKADTVVAISVPVAVLVLLGGDAIDDEVARVVVVKAADDVEHGGLARARGAQDGDEFVVAEGYRDIVECGLREGAGGVGLADLLKLKHWDAFRVRLSCVFSFVPQDIF